MVVQFAQWGNSLAVRIPSNIVKQIGAKNGLSAEIAVSDGKIVLTPQLQKPKYSLDELVSAITPENIHAETMSGRSYGEEVLE